MHIDTSSEHAFESLPEIVTLPNLTREEFEHRVQSECLRLGVAQHTDISETCRSLAVALFCEMYEGGGRIKMFPTLATYLSAACNVRFRGE